MKLVEARVRNFRLLHDVHVTFDKSSTSIVGKNNSGKTSLSVILNTFLNEQSVSFPFEDLSLRAHKRFIRLLKIFAVMNESNEERILEILQIRIPKIQLFLEVRVEQSDNWSNVKPFFADLEATDEVVILCEYAPISTKKLLADLAEALAADESVSIEEQSEEATEEKQQEEESSEEEKEAAKGLEDDIFLKKLKLVFNQHYRANVRPFAEKFETESVPISLLRKLIQLKCINAQRVLDDSSSESKSKLSKLFQNQFSSEKDLTKSQDLAAIVDRASIEIDTELNTFFSPFVGHFGTFGFPGMGNENVELVSELAPEHLLKNNVRLYYKFEEKKLPEKYNGLGYSNLIYIIAEIIGFHFETKETKSNLRLIFVEEPEAHMHPQMQSVFIKNIERFLHTVGLSAQLIVSTHSSHILSDSNLESIRYFARNESEKSVSVKDLMTFSARFGEDKEKTKEFLQQYLTLGKCDLFFADKAILFEGTVERLLLPIFIEKVDSSNARKKLQEQYISTIEIGGKYMNKFRELLSFLGLKTLIITDIDSVREAKIKDKRGRVRTVYEKHPVDSIDDHLLTSNETLKNWLPGFEKVEDLLASKLASKIEGNVRVAYQTKVPNKPAVKCGRSFEEAFILENSSYVFDNRDDLSSIKYFLSTVQSADEVLEESYEIQEFIDRNNKKVEFAFDLLSITCDDWSVPIYIKEGLEWLAE